MLRWTASKNGKESLRDSRITREDRYTNTMCSSSLSVSSFTISLKFTLLAPFICRIPTYIWKTRSSNHMKSTPMLEQTKKWYDKQREHYNTYLKYLIVWTRKKARKLSKNVLTRRLSRLWPILTILTRDALWTRKTVSASPPRWLLCFLRIKSVPERIENKIWALHLLYQANQSRQ